MNYGKNATKRRTKTYDRKSIKIVNSFGILILKALLACFIVAGVVGMSVGIGIFKGIIDSAPDISSIDVVPTGYSTTVYYNDETESATLVASGANRKYATINEIPLDMQHAFVAIEDSRFYEHKGIDFQGIVRAAYECIKTRDLSQGASTITQQLIKNNVLTSWTSETSNIEKVQRKIQEQYLALELEKKVDKDWILENYLNTINLGSNTLGVQAASEKYFGKDVSTLTLSEAAVIAGITQNPSAYNPILYPENNSIRRKSVLTGMLKQGYITQQEYDEAMADNVYDRIASYNSNTEESVNSYFVDALIDDVANDLMEKLGYTETDAYKAIYQGGLSIYSTQDPELQKICDEEVDNPDNYPPFTYYSFQLYFQIKKADGTFQSYSNQTMASYYKKKTGNQEYELNYKDEEACMEAIHAYEDEMLEEGDTLVEGSESINITLQPQVALTLMDQSTGQVKAIIGGRGEKTANRTWNRATDTCRQPGSTFKIIGCYAAALDAGGLTLASVQDDSAFTVGSKTFHNYDNSARGFTNIRTAITWSINIVTVKTLQQIGPSLGYEYAEKFGISTLTEDDLNLSLALGGLTKGVKNLELTGAYATIANGGQYNQPKFYTKVLDHDGNVLLDIEKTQERHQVLEESTAWLLTDAMKDVITSGTGGAANFGSSMAQAGKSGTTTSSRDCLWAGYTPYYTCVVWGGYDDNSKQNGKYTYYPKYLWKHIMARVHEGLEYKDFPKPSSITSASVCKKSGLLPLEDTCEKDPRGSMVYSEYFAIGTVPNETCDHHVKATICSKTKKLATEYCPKTKEKIFIVGGSEGTQDSEYALPEKKCKKHDEEYARKKEEDSEDPADPSGEENPDPSIDPGAIDPNVDPGTDPNVDPGEVSQYSPTSLSGLSDYIKSKVFKLNK